MADQPREKIPTFTTAMLAAFERCPRQVGFGYHLQRLRPLKPFDRGVARGNAAHAALGLICKVIQCLGGCPINLRERVEAQLPRAPYPSDCAWRADVDAVLGWVKWGLTTFDGTARLVAVGHRFDSVYPGDDECHPFRLCYRADLVLEHPDGTLEFSDWRIGEDGHADAMEDAAARIVVGGASLHYPRICRSTAYLAHQTVCVEQPTFDQVVAAWEQIKAVASAILSEYH